MIISGKTVSLYEAGKLLVMSQQEVLQLSQYGYLEQSKPINGRTMITMDSLERYARRNNIPLQKNPIPLERKIGSIPVYKGGATHD